MSLLGESYDDGDRAEEWGAPESVEALEERLRTAAIEFRSCIAAHSRRLARNMMLRYREHLKPHRITVTELQVLVEIALKPNVTAVALSETLALNKSTVSRIIERMVENDWIGVGASRDARTLPLALQVGTEERLLEALGAWSEAHHSVLGWLGEDAPALLRLAQRLRPPRRRRAATDATKGR